MRPGDKVRLTGKYLRSTGQTRSKLGEGLSVWTVQACECGPCSRGEWVATDEWSTLYQCQRHIAVGNIERLGQPTVAGEPTVVS